MMQKLENVTLHNFLERFINSLKHEDEYNQDNLINDQWNIPFIVSSLYQSFKNNPSDYSEFIADLEKYPDYDFRLKWFRKIRNTIVTIMNCIW